MSYRRIPLQKHEPLSIVEVVVEGSGNFYAQINDGNPQEITDIANDQYRNLVALFDTKLIERVFFLSSSFFQSCQPVKVLNSIANRGLKSATVLSVIMTKMDFTTAAK